MMEMTHRQVILDLIAKRFENVLGDDARDVSADPHGALLRRESAGPDRR